MDWANFANPGWIEKMQMRHGSYTPYNITHPTAFGKKD
jgi:hypothetical protein